MKMKPCLSRYFLIVALVFTISTAATAQNYYHRYRPYYNYNYYPDYRYANAFGPGIANYGYRPYDVSFGYYSPGFGMRINILPPHYQMVYAGYQPYYYYDGSYYAHRNNYYESVAPPTGARVSSLPSGSKVIMIDGMKYYEYKGTYYKEGISDNNRVSYEVAGNKGLRNTSPQPQIENDAVGSRIENLPDNSKPININSQKYFVAPSGIYYQEVIVDDRVVYQVVGNSSQLN